MHQEIGDRWGLFHTLAALAQLASHRDSMRAARLLGASDAIQSMLGVQIPVSARDEYERLLSNVRSELGKEPFTEAWSDGRAMSAAEIVSYAREIMPGRPSRVPERSAELRVLTLGPLEVFRKAQPIPARAWGSAKARELFVLLLCHPDGCRKDRAAAALWPDATPAQVRNNFHVTLHRMRRALGEGDWIVVENDLYALSPEYGVEFDAELFESEARALLSALRAGRPLPSSADAALARYRGDFLQNEDVGEWFVARRDKLLRLYLQTLRACAGALVRSGRYADALTYYERLLARDTTDEEIALELMKAYASLGDRAAAHRTFEQLVAALRDEIDAEPQPETVAAYRKIVDVQRT